MWTDSRKAEVLKFKEQLIALGVVKVVVPYSGSGDQGFTEEAQFVGTDGGPVKVDCPEGLQDALDVYEPDSYQNGEGGFGDITYDVTTGKITVSQNYYETISRERDSEEY